MQENTLNDHCFMCELRGQFIGAIVKDAKAEHGEEYVAANLPQLENYGDILFNTAEIEAERCLRKFGSIAGEEIKMKRTEVNKYLKGFGHEHMGAMIRVGTVSILGGYGMQSRGKHFVLPLDEIPAHIQFN